MAVTFGDTEWNFRKLLTLLKSQTCKNTLLLHIQTLINTVKSTPVSNDKILIDIILKYQTKSVLTEMLLSDDKFIRFSVIKLVGLLFDRLPLVVSPILGDMSSSIYRWDISICFLTQIRTKIKYENKNTFQWSIYEDILRQSLDMYIDGIRKLTEDIDTFSGTDRLPSEYQSNPLQSHRYLQLFDMCKGIVCLIKVLKYSHVLLNDQLLDNYASLVYSLMLFVKKIICVQSNFIQVVQNGTAGNIHLFWSYIMKTILTVVRILNEHEFQCKGEVSNSKIILRKIIKMLCSCSMNISDEFLNQFKGGRIHIIETSLAGHTNEETNMLEGFILNECTLRQFILSMLYTVSFMYEESYDTDYLEVQIAMTLSLVYKFPKVDKDEPQVKVLLHVFLEQDDELIEVLLILLKAHMKLRYCENKDKYETFINPFQLFHCFLENVSYDESVLLDWLVSVESKFIVYLNTYLRFTIDDFEYFVRTFGSTIISVIKDKVTISDISPFFSKLQVNTSEQNSESDRLGCSVNNVALVEYSSSEDDDEEVKTHPREIEDIMSCLIRLHLKLERLYTQDLLPVKLQEVTQKMDVLEELYER